MTLADIWLIATFFVLIHSFFVASNLFSGSLFIGIDSEGSFFSHYPQGYQKIELALEVGLLLQQLEYN